MIKLQNHVFIDQENCGSSVGYRIHVLEFDNKRTLQKEYSAHGYITLADCNHKIEWAFDDEDLSGSGLEKIDSAIRMLSEFRKKYAATLKTLEKMK